MGFFSLKILIGLQNGYSENRRSFIEVKAFNLDLTLKNENTILLSPQFSLSKYDTFVRHLKMFAETNASTIL